MGGARFSCSPALLIEFVETEYYIYPEHFLEKKAENGPSIFWRKCSVRFLLSGPESGVPTFWVDKRCFSEYHYFCFCLSAGLGDVALTIVKELVLLSYLHK